MESLTWLMLEAEAVAAEVEAAADQDLLDLTRDMVAEVMEDMEAMAMEDMEAMAMEATVVVDLFLSSSEVAPAAFLSSFSVFLPAVAALIRIPSEEEVITPHILPTIVRLLLKSLPPLTMMMELSNH